MRTLAWQYGNPRDRTLQINNFIKIIVTDAKAENICLNLYTAALSEVKICRGPRGQSERTIKA